MSIKREIEDYLTKGFVVDLTISVPRDECLNEVNHIISLIQEKIRGVSLTDEEIELATSDIRGTSGPNWQYQAVTLAMKDKILKELEDGKN